MKNPDGDNLNKLLPKSRDPLLTSEDIQILSSAQKSDFGYVPKYLKDDTFLEKRFLEALLTDRWTNNLHAIYDRNLGGNFWSPEAFYHQEIADFLIEILSNPRLLLTYIAYSNVNGLGHYARHQTRNTLIAKLTRMPRIRIDTFRCERQFWHTPLSKWPHLTVLDLSHPIFAEKGQIEIRLVLEEARTAFETSSSKQEFNLATIYIEKQKADLFFQAHSRYLDVKIAIKYLEIHTRLEKRRNAEPDELGRKLWNRLSGKLESSQE